MCFKTLDGVNAPPVSLAGIKGYAYSVQGQYPSLGISTPHDNGVPILI